MPADRGAVQPGRASGGAVLSADQIRDTLQAMARDRDPVLCEVLAEMVEAHRLSEPSDTIDTQVWGA